jgi:UDPglucose 6-dehydrogenase
VARDADAIVLLTEWNEFKQLDLGRLRSLMARPVFVDGRNVYEPAAMKAAGFEYISMGRGTNGQALSAEGADAVPAEATPAHA